MLKIASAEFLQGVVDLRQLPKNELREIVYIGRSNVGKSSLLNKMCNKKNLARTSTVPGKTREINYYIINNLFYFVDLARIWLCKSTGTNACRLEKVD